MTWHVIALNDASFMMKPTHEPSRSIRGMLPEEEHLICTFTPDILHRVTGRQGTTRKERDMCRSIQPLFNFEPPASDDDVHAAARQYVRKISGFTKPSRANEAAFEEAVAEITLASRRLLASLSATTPPKSREAEVARGRARALQRYGS